MKSLFLSGVLSLFSTQTVENEVFIPAPVESPFRLQIETPIIDHLDDPLDEVIDSPSDLVVELVQESVVLEPARLCKPKMRKFRLIGKQRLLKFRICR